MKTKICLLGIFAFVTLAIAAPRTWVLKTGETITGDYVSSGTTALVVKTGGTNRFLNISSLSTNDQTYAAEMQARAAKDRLDVRYFSPTLGVWTNAASLFEFATNHYVGTKLIIELGNTGYIPVEMWLGDQYGKGEDPCGTIGTVLESGFKDNSPDRNTPYAKVMSTTGHIEMYDDSNPFDDEAARWYLKAATQGVAEAQVKVGDYYSKYGLNYTEALKWYGFAVAKGNKKAMSGMARLYAQGLGVQKDMSKATELYAEAEAYYQLSRVYLMNNNHVGAYTWWCVGNVKDRKYDATFTSDYANLNFTAAERAIGANAAATYIAQRYGVNTNAIPNSAKSKPTQ
ncbi:MAG TPA: tetratricopeptide repeat protein [Verrucomicrobiae bacterium]